MDLEVIRARLVADASQFVAELEAASGALGTSGKTAGGGLAGAAEKANHGTAILRHGLVGLAQQATGTAGPVGRITQGLLTLGGGSGLVLGVAAGIGVLAIAFKALTAEARADADALKNMDDALSSLGKHGQMQAIRDQIAELERIRDDPKWFERLGQVGKQFLQSMIGGEGSTDTGMTEAINRKIAELQTKLGELGRGFTSTFRTPLADATESLREAQIAMDQSSSSATSLAEAVRISRLEYEKFKPGLAKETAGMERSAAELKASADAFRTAHDAFKEAQLAATGGGPDVRDARIAGRRALMAGASQSVSDQIAQMTLETKQLMRGIADMDELRQIGVDAGKQLVMGMAEGMQSMQDFLKAVFGMLMNFALGKLFGSLFGLIGGSLGGGVGTQTTGSVSGGGLNGSVVAPQQMGLNLSGMPAATNPLGAARDVQWQIFLRNSLLEAKAAGFRGR